MEPNPSYPQNLLWYLKNFNIFENFSQADLQHVVKNLKVEEFKKGQTILLPGKEIRRIYFLMKGKVKLSQSADTNREIILAILQQGELFGLLAPQIKEYSNPRVVAMEKCLVGYISEQDFNALLKKYPDFCFGMNQYIGERLIKVENRLEELVYHDIPLRLARTLIRLAGEFPRKKECGIQIDLKLNQQEIANLIGATRESTNTTLNRFKRYGWIDFHDRYICMHDQNALQKLLE